jgi:hypothetical protein
MNMSGGHNQSQICLLLAELLVDFQHRQIFAGVRARGEPQPPAHGALLDPIYLFLKVGREGLIHFDGT